MCRAVILLNQSTFYFYISTSQQKQIKIKQNKKDFKAVKNNDFFINSSLRCPGIVESPSMVMWPRAELQDEIHGSPPKGWVLIHSFTKRYDMIITSNI